MAFKQEAVKELRKSLNLTMQDAGLLVGVTASAWCRWEDGSTTPSAVYVGKMIEVAEKCKLKIDFFSRDAGSIDKKTHSSFAKVEEYLRGRKPSDDTGEINEIQKAIDEFQEKVKTIRESKGNNSDDELAEKMKIDAWFDQSWFKDLGEYVASLKVI